jgi:hypothetical protein
MEHMYIHHIGITINFFFVHIFHRSWQAGCSQSIASATVFPRFPSNFHTYGIIVGKFLRHLNIFICYENLGHEAKARNDFKKHFVTEDCNEFSEKNYKN